MTRRVTAFDQALRIGVGLVAVTAAALFLRQVAWLYPEAGSTLKVAVVAGFPLLLGLALATRQGFPRLLGFVVALGGLGWLAYLWSAFA